MKKLLLVITIFVTSITGVFADGSQAFKLDLKKDLIMGTTSIAAFTFGYFYKDGRSKSSSKLGWFDEGSSFAYSKSKDDIGTLISLSTLAALPFLIDEWVLEDISTVGVMYLEAALLTYGIKDILKGAISRPRPYVHRDDTSAELIAEHDSYFSFPSGHTSVAFMTASFSTYVFSQGDSNAKAKWAMGISTFSIATLTGVLRVTSGSHYPTDVIVGALFGSGIGFAVPYFHKVLPENISLVATGNSVGLNIAL